MSRHSHPVCHTVRFVLDGEIHTVQGVSPTLTVLQYLREHLGRTGTKEGCAEGDCGACTVVVAETNPESEKGLRYLSINACITFLPMLDGTVVFSVESLRKLNQDEVSQEVLHPVQQAMVDDHGSQCGFCTPGFVMTLFSLYQSRSDFDEQLTRDCLAGNLCRCTGYRPILDAARSVLGSQASVATNIRKADVSHDARDALDEHVRSQLARVRVTEDKHLEYQGQEYTAPFSIDSLFESLKRTPEAVILAGGTDIGLWVTKQGRLLERLIYIGNLPDLKSVHRSGEAIEICAAVSLADAFEVLLEEYPELSQVVRRFASPGIRNSGTLCGNIANGSPIGDSMPCLIALGARVKLASHGQRRELRLEDFYLGYQKKDLKSGEFVFSVVIPRRQENLVFRAYKVAKRFDQDISSVFAAFAIRLDKDRVLDARLCYGGLAAVPRRARETESVLLSLPWNDATRDVALTKLPLDFQPISDMRASAEYRQRVSQNLLKRFFNDVSVMGQPSVFQDD